MLKEFSVHSIRNTLPISAPMLAAYAACHMTKLCNAAAFGKYRRSMLASDMLSTLPEVFTNTFDTQTALHENCDSP